MSTRDAVLFHSYRFFIAKCIDKEIKLIQYIDNMYEKKQMIQPHF